MKLQGMRKGQSAIEYLTTYGWMLLVVAIVGGAIFTTVQNQANLQTSSGFAGADVGIGTFAPNGSGGLVMEIEATGSSDVEIENVTMLDPDTDEIAFADPATVPSDFVPLGESAEVTLATVNSATANGEFPVNISYDTRELTGLQATGTATGSFEVPDP
jgi:hypothetical protein